MDQNRNIHPVSNKNTRKRHVISSVKPVKVISRIAFAIACVASLTFCATPAKKSSIEHDIPSVERITQADAQKFARGGHYQEAAKAYMRLAATAVSPRRQILELSAADMLILGKLPDQAQETLDNITILPNQTDLQMRAYFLRAELALQKRVANDAAHWLSLIRLPPNTTESVKLKIVKLKIRVTEQQGKLLQAIEHRINLEAYTLSPKDRVENQHAIINTIALMPENTLENLTLKTRSYTLQGWLQLGKIVKRHQSPARTSRLIANWRERFQSHPATSELLSSLTPKTDDKLSVPPDTSQIALLLPMTGPFSNASIAVRDGFLAAYYDDSNNENKAKIRLYDTGASPEQIGDVYQQAIDDGATIVVGPLNKQAAEVLSKQEIKLPTLALNHLTDTTFYDENLFQFGLSPEAEARQVANRAWHDGHTRAVLVSPESSWGQRVNEAFTLRWEELGGTILNSQTYNAKKNDFSPVIKDLLNISQSNTRYSNIRRLLRTKMVHEPRRRQDIDFIFMAAFPRQARLIPPQFEFYRAADIPIYSTSHSFSGVVNKRADRDMNGITIGDMPWTLHPNNQGKTRAKIARTWPREFKRLSRLYALGVDAYNVLYYLNWLRSNPSARLSAVTGNLYMDANNHLLRQLSWARFKRGTPTALAQIPVLSTSRP